MRAEGPPPPAPPVEPAEGAPHPSAEILAAHLRGALPEPEADQVREHLTGCAECIDRVLDLEAFERSAVEGDGAGRGEESADREGEAARAESWRRLLAERPWDEPAGGPGEEATLEVAAPERPAPAPAPRTPPPPPAPPSRPALLPRRVPWHERRRGLLGNGLIAAAVAVAAVTGTWSVHLAGRLAAPDPDHPIVDLVPGRGVTRGGAGGGFPVPPRASFTAVIVPDVDVGREFDRYDVEIVDAAGRAVWRGALRPADPASPYLTLGLSRRLLSEPRYTLRLWGVGGGGRTEAGVYPLEFSP